jgi:DNA-binding response OmpR family regulator
MDGILTKPISVPALLHEIRAVIHKGAGAQLEAILA